MKHTYLPLAFTAGILSLSANAQAGDFQLSAGVEHMISSGEDFTKTGATLRGAYFFNDTWGVEGEAFMGGGEEENYVNSGVDIEIGNQFGGYAIGRFPVAEKGEMFVRAGLRSGSIDAETTGASLSYDYVGASFGGGYTHFFTKSSGLRAEVTTSGVSIDEIDSGNQFGVDGNFTSFALSYVYKFGAK